MLCLHWIGQGWRYEDGIVTAYFADGGIIDIPVGKSRKGAFYLKRLSEDSWQICPVKFPKNKVESYDAMGRYHGFIALVGSPPHINELMEVI